jgi:hypothetical protein
MERYREFKSKSDILAMEIETIHREIAVLENEAALSKQMIYELKTRRRTNP